MNEDMNDPMNMLFLENFNCEYQLTADNMRHRI